MDFGLVLQTDPPATAVVELMRRAERCGFRYGWTFDSAVLWQEPFVIYSRILEHTEHLVVGPMVTNPSTRTPEVTASTFATLNDMYGNRTVCGIGRGDSAMRVAGRKPNTLARLSESMRIIRDLAEGRETDIGGTVVKLPWVHDGRLPVWMAAYGPKALAMAQPRGRRLHPPARRPRSDPVDGQGRPRRRGRSRPRPRLAHHLRRRPPPMSPTTWPTRGSSAAGSAAWSATT
ncbi:hypothetical protein GCM10020000_15670 [Streptomyces olivoverticillatus]